MDGETIETYAESGKGLVLFLWEMTTEKQDEVIGEKKSFMVEANYALFQTDNEGNGSLYSFGSYFDEVAFDNNVPKFLCKTVIVDNWSIPHMLSTPI